MNTGKQIPFKDNKDLKKKYIIYIIPIIIAYATIFDFTLTKTFSNGKKDLIQHESNQILVMAIQHDIELPVVLGFCFLVFILTLLVLRSLQLNNFLFYSSTLLIISLTTMRIIVGLSWYFKSSIISNLIRILTFFFMIPAVGICIYTFVEKDKVICPKCRKEMEYISLYNNHYCWKCDIYNGEEKHKHQPCLRCGKEMEYIAKYDDHYCRLCDDYLEEIKWAHGCGYS